MQEGKRLNFPPIKGRIHKYLRLKGITHKDFFDKTGISSSSFSSKSANSEFGGDILARIAKKFPSMSTRWMLVGEGDMERTQATVSSIQGSNNIVASGNNTKISSHRNTYTTPKLEVADIEPNWVLIQLQEKDDEIRSKNEQIAKLHEMLTKAQDTIHALSIASIGGKI